MKLLLKIFLIRRRFLLTAFLIFCCAIIAAGSTIFAQGGTDTSFTDIEKLPVVESGVPNVEQHYLNILKKNPDDSVALNNLGMLYLQLGKTKEAKEYLLKAVSCKDKSVFISVRSLIILKDANYSGDKS